MDAPTILAFLPVRLRAVAQPAPLEGAGMDLGAFSVGLAVMALHPERFHPVIDDDWQREQFERERALEIAAGICGPDGCPLPRS